MNVIDKFEEKCMNLSLNALGNKNGFDNKLREVFGENIDISTCNDHDVILALFARNKKMGQSHFLSIKNLVKIFYECLNECGYATQESLEFIDKLTLSDIYDTANIKMSYFHNLDEVISFITMVGNAYGLLNSNNQLNIKSIAILGWYGISYEEMSAITRDNVRDNSVVLERNDSLMKVNIPEKYFDILVDYLNQKREEGLMTHGKSFNLKPSVYLFRTRNYESVSAASLRSVIKRINKYYISFGKIISIVSLKQNGLFVQIKDDWSDKEITKFIRQQLNCDRSLAFGVKQLYLKWRKEIL